MDAACHVHTSDTIYQCFICQHANVLSDSIVKFRAFSAAMMSAICAISAPSKNTI